MIQILKCKSPSENRASTSIGSASDRLTSGIKTSRIKLPDTFTYMKQSLITKIKNGKITLPKELRKEWNEGEVVFTRSPSGFLVKSITPPSLTVASKRLSKAAKQAGITAQDITQAVARARKKVYAGRA